MSEITPLGTILEGEQHRDAIHIAVAPVIAGERLYPGQHIGCSETRTNVVFTKTVKHIGIVDPFLPHHVEQGQQFWMFLYPYTITSLRHAWTHPAFEEKTPNQIRENLNLPPIVGVPDYTPISSHQKQVNEAKQRLESFADDAGITYARLMRAAEEFIEYDTWMNNGGEWEGFSIYDTFWEDYALVTGKQIEGNPGNFFTCSC